MKMHSASTVSVEVQEQCVACKHSGLITLANTGFVSYCIIPLHLSPSPLSP